MKEESPDDRASRTARAKNRIALTLILVACVGLGTLGFLFALWLRARPAGH